MTIEIPRCPECKSKLAAEGSPAFHHLKTNLWLMHVGFDGRGSVAMRHSHCNTCGRREDLRRKIHPKHQQSTP